MSAAKSHTLPDFYTWSFPGAPIQIHLSLAVVTRLRKLIAESANDSGAVCGLLIGDTSRPAITGVLDFKPLPFLDIASVEAARASISGEIVGFYRATPLFGVTMPEEDRALAASAFNRPSSVFLIVETPKSSVGDAIFGFWGDGQLFDWPLMRFPFDAGELAVGEERRRAGKSREIAQRPNTGLAQITSQADEIRSTFPVEAAMASALVSEPPAPAEPQWRGPQRRWLAPTLSTLVTATVLAGAFFLYITYFRPSSNQRVTVQAPPVRAEAKESLGLAVERRGNDLRVSWNGGSDVIAKADYGMLLIRGGSVSRDVPLTAEELRSGSVVYASPINEVRFQLNVVGGEQVTREFLTVVLPNPADSRAVQATSKIGVSDAGARSQAAAVQPPMPTRELRQFKPLVGSGTAPGAPQRIEEPPSAARAVPVSNGTPALLNQSPVSLPPPVLPAQKAPQAEPPIATPAAASQPAEPLPATVGAYPPVATNKVIPPVPTLLKGVLWKAVVVDVTVSVNVSGTVDKAVAVAKAGVNPLLSDAAVQAARRWKFRPAQFDGHPVPAEIVLQFNFAGSR